MSIRSRNQLDINQRSYSRRRVTIAGDYYSSEIEIMTDRLSRDEEQMDIKLDDDIAAFVEDDDDMDMDIKFAANARKVDGLQDRVLGTFLIQRILDCIVFDILSFSWHCYSCKAAGVTGCSSFDSSVMTTTAIVNHILSDQHYKFATCCNQSID